MDGLNVNPFQVVHVNNFLVHLLTLNNLLSNENFVYTDLYGRVS